MREASDPAQENGVRSRLMATEPGPNDPSTERLVPEPDLTASERAMLAFAASYFIFGPPDEWPWAILRTQSHAFTRNREHTCRGCKSAVAESRMKKRVRRLLRLATKKWKPSRYRLELLGRFMRGPRSFASALQRRPAVFRDLVEKGLISVAGELATTTPKGRAFRDRWVVDPRPRLVLSFDCPYLVTGMAVFLTVEPMHQAS